MKKVITICSSASFYKDVLTIEQELKALGFRVKIPSTARIMKKKGNFDVSYYKTWFKNKNDYKNKNKLMTNHFKKVVKCDAILVVNNLKNNIPGYIGGNLLMEMGLALHCKKPIYILNKVKSKHPFIEEILGVNPIFINGNLKLIK